MVKPLLQRLARLLVKTVAVTLVLPLLWLIEPFRRLRFTHLWCARFGPLAFNTHLWVGNRTLNGPEHSTTRIFFGAKPVNRQLFDMWKRVLPIVESRWLSAFFHYGGTVLSDSRFFAPLPQEFHNHRAISVQPVLSFDATDEARGRAVLAEMGLPADAGWVCFQARDPLYHQLRGFGDSGTERNCRIENYLAAAAEIVGRGDFALRMGAVAERPLPDGLDPRIIDYPVRFRSDFADIYLLGKCRFFLCCGTGSESVPPLFGVPVARANSLPLRPVPQGRRGLYIPKLIRDTANGEILPFSACEKLGAYVYDDRAKARLWEYPGGLDTLGVVAEENNEDDIRDLCLDMYGVIEGRAPDPEAARLQTEYKRRFLGHVDSVDFMPDLAPSFVLRYRHLIET